MFRFYRPLQTDFETSVILSVVVLPCTNNVSLLIHSLYLIFFTHSIVRRTKASDCLLYIHFTLGYEEKGVDW